MSAPESKLLDMTKAFVDRVVTNGEFVEVMVEYFDDNEYTQLEGDGRKFGSKQEVVDYETEFLKTVTKYYGGTIGSIGVASDDGNGNGVTMAEYSFKYDTNDGKTTELAEVQIVTWKNSKIVNNTYYYNPPA
jgi:hypothetical protein